MKGILGVFAVSFIALYYVGRCAGGDVTRRPDELRTHIVNNLELVYRSTAEGRETRLIYRVDGKILYEFDVDSNTLVTTAEAALLELEDGFQAAAALPLDDSFLTAMVATAAIGLAPKGSGSRSKQKRVAALLGAVAGFAVGFKEGASSPPALDSPQARALLDDEAEWRNFERKYLVLLALRTYQAARFAKNKGQLEEMVGHAVALKQASRGSHDVNAMDLLGASHRLNEATKAAMGPIRLMLEDDDSALKLPTASWIAWGWIALIVGGAVLSLGGVLYWRSRTDRRLGTLASPAPIADGYVFFSYARDDMNGADRLVEALERHQLPVWIDRDRVRSGDWIDVVTLALSESRAVVFLLTPRSLGSNNVRKELGFARVKGIPIIPVKWGRMEGAVLPNWFTFEFGDEHCHAFDSGTYDDGVARLVGAIRDLET